MLIGVGRINNLCRRSPQIRLNRGGKKKRNSVSFRKLYYKLLIVSSRTLQLHQFQRPCIFLPSWNVLFIHIGVPYILLRFGSRLPETPRDTIENP
jgi:hypothetical protein